MAFGLTPTGFVPKTLENIVDEVEAEFRDEFGQSLKLADKSILGRAIRIFAERVATQWELGETTNASQSPDDATGDRLDDICALTGTVRLKAKSSTATLTLTGTPTTVVAVGSQPSVTGTNERFNTLLEATIVASTAWVPVTLYIVGARVTNAGNVYLCIVSGVSAGSGGPTTEAASIVDGTVTWRFLGNGTGDIDVTSESANTGPIVGASGDIITIETPVSGWDSVMNILDATLGSNIETTEALRTRREIEIADAGNTTIKAARAALLKVTNVTSVTGFWNNKNVTDVDGVPPHAVEFVIQGGTDQDIFDALLLVVSGGIDTHGTTTGTALDDEGVAQPREFSRPTEINIHVDITLTFDATLYPTDGDAQIKAAIVAFGVLQATGKDVVSSSIKAACFDVVGVLDVSIAKIGTAPAPTLETTIVITSRQLAVHDTSRITVASSAATP